MSRISHHLTESTRLDKCRGLFTNQAFSMSRSPPLVLLWLFLNLDLAVEQQASKT